MTKECKFCGKQHKFKRGLCPASDKTCKNCGKKGHFKKMCQSTKLVHAPEDSFSADETFGIDSVKKHSGKMCQSTKLVHAPEDSFSADETFGIDSVKKHSGTPVLVTCEVNQKHNVTFEIDTGASCNIVPFSEYVKATGDKRGHKIRKTATRLTMHNNTTEQPMGRVMLYVSRNSVRHHLRFFIVNDEVTPILGRDSCVGMKLIRILDSDTIHKVVVQSSLPEIVSQDQVLSQYADVFNGLGELCG